MLKSNKVGVVAPLLEYKRPSITYIYACVRTCSMHSILVSIPRAEIDSYFLFGAVRKPKCSKIAPANYVVSHSMCFAFLSYSSINYFSLLIYMRAI